MARDYYEVLWLEKWASNDEIKKAYRKLAMQYHPDRNQGDTTAEAKFKEIGEAYGTLSDPSKKQQYDTFWTAGWAGGNPFGGGWFQAEDLGDIFSSFFGWGFSWQSQGGRRKRETRGEDLEYDLHIDLKTSIYWGKDTLEFNKREYCGSCDGAGWSDKKTCTSCNWRGQVTHTSQSPFGVIQQTRTCQECNWSGEQFENVCSECHGEKRTVKKQKLDIDIPAGIDDGMVIKLTGEGNAGVGTKTSGDLYVRFHVQVQEKWLTRDGSDLHYDLEIDFIEAVLGTKKEIIFPVIWKRTIIIDSGTQSGSILKISWDGVKHVERDTKWDLLLHIQIPTPKKISKTERELFEKLATEKKLNVNSKKWVFEKIFW